MLSESTSTRDKYDGSTLLAKDSSMSTPITMVPPENPDESEVINDENSDRSIGYMIKSQVHLPFERGWYMDGRAGDAFFAEVGVKNFRMVKTQTKAATDLGEPGEFAWDSSYIYVCVDDDTWKKVKLETLPGTDEFTSGKIFAAGNTVALESDGKVYPTRLTGADAVASSNEALSHGSGPQPGSALRVFDHSATVKVAVRQAGETYTADDIYIHRYVVNPSNASFTSSSQATLTSTGTIDEVYWWDAKMLDSTHFAVAWVDSVSATISLKTKVVDVTSGITQGSVATIASGSYQGVKVAISVESSGEYFVWYQDKSNGIKAQRCTVSGTTVTLGTSNTVTTDTLDQVLGAGLFGGTSNHLVIYDDDSAGYAVFQCGSNSGGTLTLGSAVAAGTYSGGASTSLHTVITLDSTTCLSFNAYNNVSWGLYERCVTRSGTTLTVRAATGYLDNMNGGANYPPGAVHLGNREVAVVYNCDPGPGSTDNVHRLLYYPTTAYPTFVGNYWSDTTMGDGPAGVCKGTGKALFAVGTKDATPGTSRAYFLNHTNNFDAYIGVAATAATAADQTVNVWNYGKATGMSGLTAGSRHYTNPSGVADPSRTHGAYRVGVAESATEMIVQP